uniref:hypothetical protein n=1 Tax=Thaumasiovibrio occultus TaxID=1891184 RepID=UPI00131D8A02|nr:hypothetical protein [Thaumasiovibrio occultus]
MKDTPEVSGKAVGVFPVETGNKTAVLEIWPVSREGGHVLSGKEVEMGGKLASESGKTGVIECVYDHKSAGKTAENEQVISTAVDFFHLAINVIANGGGVLYYSAPKFPVILLSSLLPLV